MDAVLLSSGAVALAVAALLMHLLPLVDHRQWRPSWVGPMWRGVVAALACPQMSTAV